MIISSVNKVPETVYVFSPDVVLLQTFPKAVSELTVMVGPAATTTIE